MTKQNNEKLRMKINHSVKNKMKNLFRNQQSTSLTKSVDVSNNIKK